MPLTADSPPRGARLFAWAGALLFVGSLGYFLYTYAVTFGETAPPDSAAGPAVAIDVALFSIFALHHSVFARERARAAVVRLVSPQLERASYVWIASAMLIAVCALWQPVPGVAWRASGAAWWALVAAQSAGIALVLRSALLIDIFDLSGVRQLTRAPGPIEFTSAGPYGWVRHPIYAGWVVLVFCAPTMTMTRLVFAAVSTAYVLIGLELEERSLRAAAAGTYAEYARKVRWKVIPGLY